MGNSELSENKRQNLVKKSSERKPLPDYLKRPIINIEKTQTVRKILKDNNLNTVCENARCPNKNECYQKNTATFLIMGSVCTRNCRYCNIGCETPNPLDSEEPKHIAKAVKELGLKYVVLTSVTRDDLQDGGAEHFAQCLKEIKLLTPQVKTEILTPDFKGDTKAIDIIIKNHTTVFNHNIETVKRVFKTARPQGNYQTSLNVLKYVKENSDLITKSGLMVGLGETFDEIELTLKDLNAVGCDILTIGQYLSPSKNHLPVDKYYTLEEFEELKKLAKNIGFKNYQIGPLVRSSYKAAETSDFDNREK